MIKPIVQYLMRRSLKEEKRRPSLVHGDLITSIAVVAVNDQSEEYAHISKYVKELRQRGIKVVDFYIGFTNKKTFESYQGSLKDYPFTKSSLNWFGKISSSELKQIEKANYDVVIDLSQGKLFAADVVLSKIKAKWKAGAHSTERLYLLDFVIELKGNNDIRQLIHHLDHYLTNFNKMHAA